MKAWLKKQNIFYWILSLVLAILFWLYVSITQDQLIDRTFSPVPEFLGQETLESEKGIVITDGLNVAFEVTLRGAARDLALCDRDNIQVLIRLNDLTGSGEERVYPEIYLPEEVRDKVSVFKKSKDFFVVKTDKIDSKVIDIKTLAEGIHVLKGYTLESIELDPPQVRVSGRLELLNLITGAQIAPIQEDLDGTKNFIAHVELVHSEGADIPAGALTLAPQEVSVTLVVSKSKEVDLSVDLIEGGGAMERHVSLDIRPRSITITGDPGDIDPVNYITLGSIDLAETNDGSVLRFPITLPNGTKSNAVSEAEVTVRFVGLATRNVYTENITITGGERDGYTVRLVEPGLPITLRGPQSSIDQLANFNVRVLVELADVELIRGQQSVKVRVIVDGYPDVGAIGSPKVTVEMLEIQDDEP